MRRKWRSAPPSSPACVISSHAEASQQRLALFGATQKTFCLESSRKKRESLWPGPAVKRLTQRLGSSQAEADPKPFEVDGKTPMDSSKLWIMPEMHRREQSSIKVEMSIFKGEFKQHNGDLIYSSWLLIQCVFVMFGEVGLYQIFKSFH